MRRRIIEVSWVLTIIFSVVYIFDKKESVFTSIAHFGVMILFIISICFIEQICPPLWTLDAYGIAKGLTERTVFLYEISFSFINTVFQVIILLLVRFTMKIIREW